MGKIFNKVSPGDLITAELMNKVTETIEKLDERLTAMETATKGSISGSVKDAVTDSPIVGAKVRAILGSITHESPPTDSSGQFTITDLLPGDYLVTASAENYLDSAVQTVSIAQGVGRVANFVLTPTAGVVIVPKLFGLSLALAKTTLTDSSVGLVPGDVYATDGEHILPTNTEALQMVVLNQVPDAGEAVQAGSAVDMVIASLPSEPPTGPVTPQHVVTGILPSGGARVGEEVAIIGENFVAPLSRNKVRFGTEEAPTPRPGSTSTRLQVIVPDTLTGLPASFRVCVEIDGVSKCLPHDYPIDVASEEPPLLITATDPPNLGTIGSPLTIIGTGFDPTPGNNQITFILVSDTTKQHQIFPDSVQTVGDVMHMTIDALGAPPNEFPTDMTPSTGTTPFQIKLAVGDKETQPFAILLMSL